MRITADVKAPMVGVDTSMALTPENYAAIRAKGIGFVVRYLGLRTPTIHDLTDTEVGQCLAAGLGLMAIQQFRITTTWAPDEALGGQDGLWMVKNAKASGIPKGVSLWLDLEGTPGAPESIIAYANAWFEEVAQAGYLPGVYEGPGLPLTGHQWYNDLKCTRYWKSMARVPPVEPRGYCLIQLWGQDQAIGSAIVDYNVAQKDWEGGCAVMAVEG